ncbi:holin family protein [Paracoccus yeei]|uniref:holin family protein n=1 Tax=Paracoccus yeei TaxID=147645 RepID=UPI0028D77FB9|nr:holin family protein [Paracoccus yeei]
MGVMDRFLGASTAVTTVANAATGVAEVFRVNETRKLELDEEAYARAIGQMSGEFAAQPRGWFDGLMNGMNRLPRPILTLGTVGLFVYAMVEPVGFGLRMENLNLVPEPLWWLLGAIISFYFGAREAHYFRTQPRFPRAATAASPKTVAGAPDANPALDDWAEAQAARH